MSQITTSQSNRLASCSDYDRTCGDLIGQRSCHGTTTIAWRVMEIISELVCLKINMLHINQNHFFCFQFLAFSHIAPDTRSYNIHLAQLLKVYFSSEYFLFWIRDEVLIFCQLNLYRLRNNLRETRSWNCKAW